jgi:hypothetical protein
MTNISKLYQQLSEGEISKDYFVRRARIEHSNIVSPVNSYDDIVKILRNKGVLTEAVKLSTEQIIDRLNPYAVKKGIEVEMAKCKGAIELEKIREKVAKNLSKNQKYYEEYQFPNAKVIDKHDSKQEMRQVKSELVDKNNAMRKPKGFSPDKANTKASKKENRKGNPKGVKMMKENSGDQPSNNMGIAPEKAHYKVGTMVPVPTEKGTVEVPITRIEGDTAYVEINGQEMPIQFNILNQYTPKETPYEKGSEEMDNAWKGFNDRPFSEEEEASKTTMSEIVGKLKEFLAKRKSKKGIKDESSIMKNPENGDYASVGSDSASKTLANKMNYTQRVPGSVVPLGKKQGTGI